MEPIDQFKINIDAAWKYLLMYRELRKLKNLGGRGILDADNKYLLWLPRASIVSSLSSLDAYVHQVLYNSIPEFLRHTDHMPDKLSNLVIRILPIKNTNHVVDAIQYIRSPSGPERLAEKISQKVICFESYQAPDKVVEAYRIISIPDVLQEVANRWSGPYTDREHIATRLERYTKRRNQIVHEGDLTMHSQPREITPDLGASCAKFITNLVTRMDEIEIKP